MPVCRECQRQLPTVEVRRAPKGWRCKDRNACLWRQHKQRVGIAK